MHGRNSIFVKGYGLVELESAWDIAEEAKPFLQDLRGDVGSVLCTCCERPLTFVEHRTRPHLRQLHQPSAVTCWHSRGLERVVGPEAAKDVYRSSIITSFDSLGCPLPDGDCSEGFGLWGRSILSRSYASTFSGFKAPSEVTPSYISNVFKSIETCLDKTVFSDSDENPYCICNEHETELCFGIAAESAAIDFARDDVSDRLPIAVWSWTNERLESPHVLYVPEEELFRCAQRLNNFGHITRGPYFFLAQVNGINVLRLYLCPVALYAGRIAPNDSEVERQDICRRWAIGEEVYKPLRSRDQVLLHPALRTSTGQTDFLLSYRPDLTSFAGGNLKLWEIKGYDGKKHPLYEALFRRKEIYYKAMKSLGHFDFEAIEASAVWRMVGKGYSQDSLPTFFQREVITTL